MKVRKKWASVSRNQPEEIFPGTLRFPCFKSIKEFQILLINSFLELKQINVFLNVAIPKELIFTYTFHI